MAFTKLQNLRKMRARNKGMNSKLAANLRSTAKWLDRKGPDELSRSEIVALQSLRSLISNRLYVNALTGSVQIVLDGKCRIVNGKYRVDLDRKDL
jgi:hypothetical protein